MWVCADSDNVAMPLLLLVLLLMMIIMKVLNEDTVVLLLMGYFDSDSVAFMLMCFRCRRRCVV